MLFCVLGFGVVIGYLGACWAFSKVVAELMDEVEGLNEANARMAVFTARLLDSPRFYAQQRQENILATCTDPETN